MASDTATNGESPSAASPDSRPPNRTHRASRVRRAVEAILLLLIALLIFRTVGAEPYGVPTGSMAPTLLGHHKSVVCPRCGYPVIVGVRDGKETGAICPNCGCDDLHLDDVPVCRGDHLLVNKHIYSWRKPRRWEMAVFRCPVDDSKAFVKRVVGLPGEAVQIRDGDIYIDGELARKTLAEFKAMRIPVFDNDYQPSPEGWRRRWQLEPHRGPAILEGTSLRLDGMPYPEDWQWLVYRHWSLDDYKVQAIRDEYTYDGKETVRRAEPVHDFMLECDVEVIRGEGAVALAVTDGAEQIIAEVPVGESPLGTRLLGRPDRAMIYRTAPSLGLIPGQKHHVELAFVDRRASLAFDGELAFAPVDRPVVERRPPVDQPIRIGARGVEVRIDHVRIFRDIHYTGVGSHASRTPVRLGAGQYFMLGDNSPNSDDNRFWSDADDRPVPVTERNFLGKPFLVHLPSRIVSWDGLGMHWEHQAIDWGRIRWLH
jgi:signal peptidase I